MDGASRTSARDLRYAYGASLLMVLVSIVLSVALDEGAAGLVIVGLLQGFTLLATLRVSGARRQVMLATMAVAGIATLLAAGLTYQGDEALVPLVPALWGFIVLGAIGAIMRRVTQFAEVNMQSVFGLLTLYLLIGILFSYLFMLVGSYREFFNGGEGRVADYVYFAFVTLSTTGYGDLTPAAGVPRALAIALAMTGQLYLVSVVAVAVSRMAARERTSR